MGTEIEAISVAEMSNGAAAEVLFLLEQGDPATPSGQVDRRRQTSNPAAHDNDVLVHGAADLNANEVAKNGASAQFRVICN
jgi:hypothetical protein